MFGVASTQRRRHWRESPHANTDAELEIEDPAPHPERAAQLRQMRGLVVAALDQVPLKRRAVLIMHDIDQLPMGEIAVTLQINMFTAYSPYVRRGRSFEWPPKRCARAEIGRKGTASQSINFTGKVPAYVGGMRPGIANLAHSSLLTIIAKKMGLPMKQALFGFCGPQALDPMSLGIV